MRKKNIYIVIGVLFVIIILGIGAAYKLIHILPIRYNYAKGSLMQQAGQYKEAVYYYTEVLNADDRHILAYISRGSAYVDLKQYGKAIQDYNSAIKIDPDNEQAYAYRGRAYYDMLDTNKALSDYNKALSLNKDFGYAYYHRGLLKTVLLKDFDGSCRDLIKAKKLGFQEADELLKDGSCH